MADFILTQSVSFLAFFCCGICAAAFFDSLRIFRRLLPHNRQAIALEDILFWLITGIVLFNLLLLFQSGRLRIFLPVSSLLGAALWKISFGRLFLGPILHFLLFLKNKIKSIHKKFT